MSTPSTTPACPPPTPIPPPPPSAAQPSLSDYCDKEPSDGGGKGSNDCNCHVQVHDTLQAHAEDIHRYLVDRQRKEYQINVLECQRDQEADAKRREMQSAQGNTDCHCRDSPDCTKLNPNYVRKNQGRINCNKRILGYANYEGFQDAGWYEEDGDIIEGNLIGDFVDSVGDGLGAVGHFVTHPVDSVNQLAQCEIYSCGYPSDYINKHVKSTIIDVKNRQIDSIRQSIQPMPEINMNVECCANIIDNSGGADMSQVLQQCQQSIEERVSQSSGSDVSTGTTQQTGLTTSQSSSPQSTTPHKKSSKKVFIAGIFLLLICLVLFLIIKLIIKFVFSSETAPKISDT